MRSQSDSLSATRGLDHAQALVRSSTPSVFAIRLVSFCILFICHEAQDGLVLSCIVQ